MADYYPKNPDALAAWFENFASKLPGALATKYGISAATLAKLATEAGNYSDAKAAFIAP